MKRLKNMVLSFARNRAVHKLLFWALSAYILLHIFSLSSSFQKIDFIYTAIFLGTILIPVELNLLIFIPRLLNKKKYMAWIFTFVISLFLFSYFNQIIFSKFIDTLLPGYYFISYYSYGDLLKFFLVFMVVSTLIHLSKEWFELNEARHNLTRLEKEKVAAELKALSNQLNPHFLFNSLNVIYSMAINNKKEAPDAILQLSDILRYVIYDANASEVSLQDEIKLIRDFIALQRFRSIESAQINFEVDVENEQLNIAPMLFLPLIENSFKHGLKGDIQNTFVNIRLTFKKTKLIFTIENNKGWKDSSLSGRDSGVGLENIQNRLALIYPKKHTFEIKETENSFKVTLSVDLEIK
ncbi:MAG: sensor histidine kinase [Bacteroidales bacterium]|nr:sensor histidine kinase [Bacteroidales bacterium]MCF8402986.1 sensor histidine kinase [Bacteroidales bacterium]